MVCGVPIPTFFNDGLVKNIISF